MVGGQLDEILRQVKERGVKFIRYLYIDLDNVIRGRISSADNLAVDIAGGLTLASIMQAGFSIMDKVVPGTVFGPVGEVRLKPDISTFKILPYAEGSALFISEQYLDDKPFNMDPRPILREKILRNIKYGFKIGVEPEFYLFRSEGLEPYDRHLVFATPGMNAIHEFLRELVEALAAQDIYLEHYYPEYGTSQHEFSLKPADLIRAADNLILFRETVRALAQKRNLIASFMPKPSHELPGSGLHLHISVWRDGVNILYSDADKYGLSEEGYHFIGGILRHLRSMLAITAASVNSYKRLKPNMWASAFTCWGPENREAAIRIPKPVKGTEEKSFHLEAKFVDATAQPYLAVGSIIAAGLRGIEEKIEPGEPCEVNPASLSEEERLKRGWYRYPENLFEAVRELERDAFFKEVWGDALINEYIKVKKFQWEVYHSMVTDWERSTFISVY